ncbi:MAG: four helix bundle protein [Patescibacteria group bacterium]|nr:four helix bundle protein [Patescibacteria group bacterium]
MQNDREKFKKEFIKRLINLSIKVIKFSESIKKHIIFYSILDQLVRSTTSIGANVIEAKSSSSTKDYIHYFETALKSANETKYWIYIIQNIVNEENLVKQSNEILKEVNEIANILASSLLKLKGKK